MSETQETLRRFGVDATKEPIERIRQPVDTISVLDSIGLYETGTLDEDLLPEITGYNWEVIPIEYDEIEAMEWWRASQLARNQDYERQDPENIPGAGGVIISGAEEYLREHALTEIGLPKYYSRFEDEVGTVFRWSVDGITHIDWRQVKRAVRLSNGGGRVDTGTTRVVLCDTGNLIVTGPRGCFIVEAFNSDYARQTHSLPEPPEQAVVDIGELSIAEENPRMQAALRRWVQLMEQSDFSSPVSHCRLVAESPPHGNSTVAHQFETAAGDEIELSADDLSIVHGQQRTRTEIERFYQFESPSRVDDAIYTAVVDDLPGDIGEEIRVCENETGWEGGDEISGIISGYRADWKVQKRVHGMSGRKRPTKLKFRVRIGILRSDGTLAIRSQDIAEFDLR
jgi:hypothetical protein